MKKLEHIIKKEIIIKIKKLTKFYDDKLVLKNLNLNIYKNEILLIVGKSGSGKTTLIKILNKYITDYSGKILLFNKNINQYNNLPLYMHIVKQNFQINFNPFFTVYDFLKESFIIKHCNDKNMIKLDNFEQNIKITHIMNIFKLSPDLLYNKIKILSYGQQQRIMLCRMLILQPKILILDEATSALDIFNVFPFLEYIKNFFNTVVIISHDLDIFKNFSDRIAILNNYKIEEIIHNKNINSWKNYNFKTKYAKKLFNLTIFNKKK